MEKEDNQEIIFGNLIFGAFFLDALHLAGQLLRSKTMSPQLLEKTFSADY